MQRNAYSHFESSVGCDESVSLAWQDLVVRPISSKKDKEITPNKIILDRVSGYAEPGTLVVIMGSSGAGKSTLLNVLTRRNLQNLEIEGRVCLNGQPFYPHMAHLLGYVQQDDVFVGTLTVREHLWFNSSMLMSSSYTKEERISRVNDIMKLTGLLQCADTKIGMHGFIKGISGGEAKRLALSSKILTNPPLLLCDEPTTGLDSFLALAVMKVLKDLTNRGHTVVCTIHQPASHIFAAFDRLMLLDEGRVAYFGNASDVNSYFSSIGWTCPRGYNTADFIMQAMGGARKKHLDTFPDTFSTSEISLGLSERAEALCMQGSNYDIQASIKRGSKVKYGAPWLVQVYCCAWRNWAHSLRNYTFIPLKLLISVLTGLLTGTIFFQIPYNEAGVQSLNGCLFAVATVSVYNVFLTCGLIMQSSLAMYWREHEDGLYGISAYYAGRVCCEVPIMVLGVIPYAFIIYIMVGLVHSEAIFLYFLVAIILTIVGVLLGYLIGISVNTPDALAHLGSVFITTLVYFNPFTHRAESARWLEIIEKLSFFKYALDTLIVNQWFDDDPKVCTGSTDNVTCPLTELVKEEYGLEQKDEVIGVVANSVIGVALLVLCMLGLLIKERNRRTSK